MTARDLFTDTPSAETPAAEAPHRHETDHEVGQGTGARLPSSGVLEQLCGGCGSWTEHTTGFGFCEHAPKWRTFSPRAACHFEPSKWVAISVETIARRDAQKGIDDAAEAADRRHRGWTETAFEFVKLYALQNKGRQYIGHDIVRASAVRGIIQPENSKAWGQPIQRAARAKIIKRVGYAPDPNRHTNPVPLWETA